MISLPENHNLNGLKSGLAILVAGVFIATSIKYIVTLYQKRAKNDEKTVEGDEQSALKNGNVVKPPAKEWRIAVLGLSGSGKSSVVAKTFCKNDNAVASPSKKSLNVLCKEMDGYSVFIWEFCHIQQAKKHWFKFVKKCSGTLMFVVDCSDTTKLAEAKHEFYDIMYSDHMTDIPVILVASKQDVSGAISGEQLKKEFDLEELKHVVHSIDVIETGQDPQPDDSSEDPGRMYEGDYLRLMELMKKQVDNYINEERTVMSMS